MDESKPDQEERCTKCGHIIHHNAKNARQKRINAMVKGKKRGPKINPNSARQKLLFERRNHRT